MGVAAKNARTSRMPYPWVAKPRVWPQTSYASRWQRAWRLHGRQGVVHGVEVALQTRQAGADQPQGAGGSVQPAERSAALLSAGGSFKLVRRKCTQTPRSGVLQAGELQVLGMRGRHS